MVSMTRAEGKEAFNYVFNTVLDRDDKSPLKSSLISEGITNIFDLITIPNDVIDSLHYEDPAEPGKLLSFYVCSGINKWYRSTDKYHAHRCANISICNLTLIL